MSDLTKEQLLEYKIDSPAAAEAWARDFAGSFFDCTTQIIKERTGIAVEYFMPEIKFVDPRTYSEEKKVNKFNYFCRMLNDARKCNPSNPILSIYSRALREYHKENGLLLFEKTPPDSSGCTRLIGEDGVVGVLLNKHYFNINSFNYHTIAHEVLHAIRWQSAGREPHVGYSLIEQLYGDDVLDIPAFTGEAFAELSTLFLRDVMIDKYPVVQGYTPDLPSLAELPRALDWLIKYNDELPQITKKLKSAVQYLTDREGYPLCSDLLAIVKQWELFGIMREYNSIETDHYLQLYFPLFEYIGSNIDHRLGEATRRLITAVNETLTHHKPLSELRDNCRELESIESAFPYEAEIKSLSASWTRDYFSYLLAKMIISENKLELTRNWPEAIIMDADDFRRKYADPVILKAHGILHRYFDESFVNTLLTLLCDRN